MLCSEVIVCLASSGVTKRIQQCICKLMLGDRLFWWNMHLMVHIVVFKTKLLQNKMARKKIFSCSSKVMVVFKE